MWFCSCLPGEDTAFSLCFGCWSSGEDTPFCRVFLLPFCEATAFCNVFLLPPSWRRHCHYRLPLPRFTGLSAITAFHCTAHSRQVAAAVGISGKPLPFPRAPPTASAVKAAPFCCGSSGCIWPFMLGARTTEEINGSLIAPWFDVHGDADLRVSLLVIVPLSITDGSSNTHGKRRASHKAPWGPMLSLIWPISISNGNTRQAPRLTQAAPGGPTASGLPVPGVLHPQPARRARAAGRRQPARHRPGRGARALGAEEERPAAAAHPGSCPALMFCCSALLFCSAFLLCFSDLP